MRVTSRLHVIIGSDHGCHDAVYPLRRRLTVTMPQIWFGSADLSTINERAAMPRCRSAAIPLL